MKILSLSLLLMALVAQPIVQGGRKCTNPKGNDGESYTEGCLKKTCKAGVYRTSVNRAICCYNRQPYLPNTTITATEDGCATASLYCRQDDDVATAVLHVENNCGEHSTEEQVQEIKNLLVRLLEQTDCDKDSSVSTSTPSTTMNIATSTPSTTTNMDTSSSSTAMNPTHDLEGFILSSTGRAAEYWGDALGLYEEQNERDDENNKVFKQMSGKNFIYKKEDRWWCGTSVGRASLYTTELFSHSGNWHFRNGDAYRNDLTMQFLPLTPTSCILQPSIMITSTGPANSIRGDYLGSFSIVQGVFLTGRPVWRNNKGKVLKIKPGTTNWGLFDTIESTIPYVTAASGPTCPTDSKASHSDRMGRYAWTYDNGKKWEADATILVQ